MDKQTLLRRYQELQAINDGAASLGQHDRPALQTVQRFNAIVQEIATGTGDDSLPHYKVQFRSVGSSGRQYAQSSEFKQNVYTVTRIVHENHLADSTLPPQRPVTAGDSQSPVNQTFQQNQHATQTTEVSVEFNQTIITLTEMLTRKEAELEDGTPEKGFIQKLKSMLAGTKSTIDVIRLAMTIAAEFGLTIQQVKDLLN